MEKIFDAKFFIMGIKKITFEIVACLITVVISQQKYIDTWDMYIIKLNVFDYFHFELLTLMPNLF